MGIREWIAGGTRPQNHEPDRQPIRKYAPGEMAFRFEKPFQHLKYFMSAEEKTVVAGIEERWKQHYEYFKNYPPMSEHQEHSSKVFRAVDDAFRALDAREKAPFKDWKRLEAEVDKAMGRVREEFVDQRKAVERDMYEAGRCCDQTGPTARGKKKFERSRER